MDDSFGKGIQHLSDNQKPRAVYNAVVDELEDEDLKPPTKEELFPLIRECLRLSKGRNFKCTVRPKLEFQIQAPLIWDDGMTARLSLDPEDIEPVGTDVVEEALKKAAKELRTYNRDIQQLEKKCAKLDRKYEVDSLPEDKRIFSLICDTVFFDWATPPKRWY